MRRLALPGILAAALVAATVAYAADGSRSRGTGSLAHAVAASTSARSLRFQLTVRLEAPDVPPQTLHVAGATGGRQRYVHLKVDDIVAPDGSRIEGPSADEKVDGHFVYLRSTVTQQALGRQWLRERLSELEAGSPELRALQSVAPAALLHALTRVHAVAMGPQARVFHARLPYQDGAVRDALAGVDGGLEFRDLRTTVWLRQDGRVGLVLVTGRTADSRSTLLLTLSLSGYGRPVAVRPPGAGSFVDPSLGPLGA
jgi:hypothetical protein